MKLLRATAFAAGAAILASVATAQDFTMKISIGDSAPAEGERHHGRTPLAEFVKEVNEKSGGRIDAKVYWDEQLGKTENVLNLVRSGHVEGQIAADGQLAPYYNDIQMFGIPYLFITPEVYREVMDGPFGEAFSEEMAEASGILPIAWMENGGYRHFSANRPLRSVEDMQGLKIRTMNNPVHMDIVRSLGASPTPVPWGDLYTSLQTGVVDGQENSLATFRVPRLEEVQDHIILDGHVLSIVTLAISKTWFDSLPADLQEVVRTAARNMEALNREIVNESNDTDRAFLEEAGVEIYEPDEATKAQFRELTQGPAVESIRSSVDNETLDALLAAISDAEAKL